MAYENLATSQKRLETEHTNVTRRHFFRHPIFVLKIPLFAFSYRIFFWDLFVLTYFDSSRRQTPRGRKKFAPKWRHLMRVFAGEASQALALSLAFAA